MLQPAKPLMLPDAKAAVGVSGWTGTVMTSPVPSSYLDRIQLVPFRGSDGAVDAVGLGVGLAVGLGVGLAVGFGVGLAVGFGVG